MMLRAPAMGNFGGGPIFKAASAAASLTNVSGLSPPRANFTPSANSGSLSPALNQACTAAGTKISEAAPAPSRGYNALHTHKSARVKLFPTKGKEAAASFVKTESISSWCALCARAFCTPGTRVLSASSIHSSTLNLSIPSFGKSLSPPLELKQTYRAVGFEKSAWKPSLVFSMHGPVQPFSRYFSSRVVPHSDAAMHAGRADTSPWRA
mmetsp:Transcript_44159/g.73527  ORF Transcript_44159/g.73527 Transcript_44159/m.73527 type:complete len:209 (+) Transcript_44159:2729-3355(+)